MNSLKPFELGPWLVHPMENKISHHGSDVELQPRVMRLLVFLNANEKTVCSKEDILKHVWGVESISRNAVPNAIQKLRCGLQIDGRDVIQIESVRGIGYCLRTSNTTERAPEHETQSNNGQPPPAQPFSIHNATIFVLVLLSLILALILYRSHSTTPFGPNWEVEYKGD